MKIRIALFRGINVGGKNSLQMKQLVSLLEEIGCQHVKTYIQSGNVVFKSKESSASRLSNKMSFAIKKHFGFEPFVLLLEAEDVKKAILDNPFPDAESNPKSLHLGFLSSPPKNPDLKMLETLRKKTERFVLTDAVFYLYAPEGVGRSKLAANAEKLIGVSMTARNWRTVSKIKEMVKELN
jgi:uncharacterized protein (DUF1697 family)